MDNSTLLENISDQSFFSGSYRLVALATSFVVIYFVAQFFQKKSGVIVKPPHKSNFLSKNQTLDNIVPVPDSFDWKAPSSVKPYPFKSGEYKLTMGIKSLDFNDWLLIEPSYLSHIEYKKKIVTNTHPDYPSDKDLTSNTVFSTEEAIPAIHELYLLVVGFLCKRYPMYFKKKGDSIQNTITGKFIPATVDKNEDVKSYLHYLVDTIEEDFIILLKDPTKEHDKDGDEY